MKPHVVYRINRWFSLLGTILSDLALLVMLMALLAFFLVPLLQFLSAPAFP